MRDTVRAIRAVVEALPGAGSTTRIERVEPWFVYRVHLDGEPSSVVVKRLRDEPNGFRIDPAQVDTEVAALRFVEALGLTFTPRVLATDSDAHLIVMEDLHPRVPLPDVLIAGDLGAEASYLAFARALGSLNAATAGRAADLDLPVVVSPEEAELVLWRETLAMVEAFGVPVTDPVLRDIGSMFRELDDPGPFLALSNGDPGTNNFLVAPRVPGRLIDFEFARFRHALLDVVHVHVQSPQWITLPDGGPFEDVYRRQLVGTVPEAMDDDRFGSGLAAACLSYALVRLHRLRKLAARRAGNLSRLQLVATLESAARVAWSKDVLAELAGFCADVASEIRRRWPDTDVDLGGLPPWLARDPRSRGIIDGVRTVPDGA